MTTSTTNTVRSRPVPTRAQLLGALQGTVLEIGAGAGVNLPLYRPGVHWVGLEPDARTRQTAARHAEARGSARVMPGRAERIELPDASVDAVVGTLVLCSVADPEQVLAEVLRVLRPGGRYALVEHVAAAPGTWVRAGQRAWSSVTSGLGAECRVDRDSAETVRAAGFGAVDLVDYTMPGSFGMRMPFVAGYATK